MVTTSRKFELIIRSRASASPFFIFAASSISSSSVKSGIRPISRRYLLGPVSLSFMTRTYSLDLMHLYFAFAQCFAADALGELGGEMHRHAGLARMYPANAIHQCFARCVLEQVTFRAGLNGTVDIFVPIERR